MSLYTPVEHAAFNVLYLFVSSDECRVGAVLRTTLLQRAATRCGLHPLDLHDGLNHSQVMGWLEPVGAPVHAFRLTRQGYVEAARIVLASDMSPLAAVPAATAKPASPGDRMNKQRELGVSSSDDFEERVARIMYSLYGEAFDFIGLRDAMRTVQHLHAGQKSDEDSAHATALDLKQAFDQALAAARLIDGYEKSHREKLGPDRAIVAIQAALFHDGGASGTSCTPQGSEAHGQRRLFSGEAEFTKYLSGIERYRSSAQRLRRIVRLSDLNTGIRQLEAGLAPDLADLARIVATAHLASRFSDRAYLEQSTHAMHRRLTRDSEFTGRPADLLPQSLKLLDCAVHRLAELHSLNRCYPVHFATERCPYLDGIERNRRYAARGLNNRDLPLRRTPCTTPFTI